MQHNRTTLCEDDPARKFHGKAVLKYDGRVLKAKKHDQKRSRCDTNDCRARNVKVRCAVVYRSDAMFIETFCEFQRISNP